MFNKLKKIFSGKNIISIDEFKKIELKVARILKAEKVEGSGKLLKLEVDLGEKRQIIAGIAKNYQAEDLIGREIIIVSNLKSKPLFGLKSNGMLLAASDSNGPVLLMPDKEVSPGSKIN